MTVEQQDVYQGGAVAALPEDHARETFDAFADYYDTFTAHHDYPEWTASLERLAKEAGMSGRRLLDVACGTGKSFLPMLDRDYEVTACDISEGMIARARERAAGRATVLVADMRRLPELGRFDLVFALCDAVNYLLTEEELESTFRGVARNLADGGVLVFDANTLASYRAFFSSPSVVSGPDQVLVWEGQAPADFAAGDVAPATVIAFEADGPDCWRRRTFRHYERHHPESTIREALSGAGLECAGLFSHGLDGNPTPGLEESGDSKAIYVARRP
jgi:SAM-dependent methyltransferase